MPDRPDPEHPQRLQKILAQWGIASRRYAETLIAAGRVRVNGQVAELGAVAQTHRDRIEVDGQWVRPADRPDLLHLLLNKPPKVLSACADDRGRATVLDLLPRALTEQTGLHPVGRLDWDSTGALLLTNHGELTHALTHPRFHLPKTYRVWVQGQPRAADLDRWRTGLPLDGHLTLPAQVRVVQTLSDRRGDRTELEIVLVEGRNRQIRRLAALLNHPVIKLHRVAIGSLMLRSPDGQRLPSGCYRELTPAEIRTLYDQTGLDRPR